MQPPACSAAESEIFPESLLEPQPLNCHLRDLESWGSNCEAVRYVSIRGKKEKNKKSLIPTCLQTRIADIHKSIVRKDCHETVF